MLNVYLDEMLSRAECKLVDYIYAEPGNGLPSNLHKLTPRLINLGIIERLEGQFGYRCTNKVSV